MMERTKTSGAASTKPSTPLQLTLFVTDSKGNIVLEHEGELNFSIGNRGFNAPIGHKGRTNFGEIAALGKGDSITIGLVADGWEIAGANRFEFTGEPITLKVKKNLQLGIIKGIVMTQDGEDFLEGVAIRINGTRIIYTNDQGIFKDTLPEEMIVRNMSKDYTLTFSKKGFHNKTRKYPPNSPLFEIGLDPKEN